MPKGFWIASIDISDPDTYKHYVAANALPFAKYGARFLVRAGQFQVLEGTAHSRNVVIEFPSYQAALDCYHSPEYQHAKAIRLPVASGNLLIVEGYEGLQPG